MVQLNNMKYICLAALLAKQSTRAFQSMPAAPRAGYRSLSSFAPNLPAKTVGFQSTMRLFSTSVDVDEINAKIKAKGDEIRQLKADGMEKADLAPHIEELLAFKAQLPPDENAEPPKPKKQKPEKKKKQAPAPAKKEEEMSESEIKLNRLSKVAGMREAGIEPFEYTFDVTRTAAQLAAEYDGRLEGGEEDEESSVGVAGRIMTRRVFGKLAFFTLQDETGTIQLQFDKKRLGDSFKVSLI